MNWDNLWGALVEEFERIEDLEKVWHEVQELKQQDNELVESYIKKFAMLWESLCKALQSHVAPLHIMKKDKFLAGLQDGLHWRVELNNPRSFEYALEVAKNKEWKLKRKNLLRVDTL